MKLLAVCLVGLSGLVGCARSGDADGGAAPGASNQPSAVVSVDVASVRAVEDRCVAIAGEIAQREAELLRAGTHRLCQLDQDCECFGPPQCSGRLGAGCPFPLAVRAAEQLRPLVQRWAQANCGPPIWSPYRCEPACREGLCVSLAD